MAAEIKGIQLAAGALAANTQGRALMASSFFNNSTTFDDKVAAGAIGDDRLVNKIVKELGAAGVQYISLAVQLGDGARSVTIDGDPYVPAVAASIGDTAEKLAALINAGTKAYAYTAQSTLGAEAFATVAIVRRTVGAGTVAISATPANWLVGAATTLNGEATAVQNMHAGTYTVLAADVTAWALGAAQWIPVGSFSSTTAPRAVLLQVRNSANVAKAINATVSYKYDVFGAGFYGVFVADTGPTLAAGDLVSYIVL